MTQSTRTAPPTGTGAATTHGVVDAAAVALLVPVAVARRVLPDRGLPVYLGAGALAIVGVVDWPVAVAACLGYSAIKRWTGPGREPGRDRDALH